MKKKTMAFGGLLMAVAVTAYSVCGTYAKYISSFDIADEARVAKWEFSLTGGKSENDYDIDLFRDSYSLTKGDKTYTYVVSNEPGIKVVAPGTAGKYDFNIAGTAETNYTVAVSDVVVENTIRSLENNYDPIRFSMDGNKWMTAEELKTELEGLFDSKTVYPANYALNEDYSIQWKWAFEKKTITNEDGSTREVIVDAAGNELSATDFVSNDSLDTELARKQGTVKVSLKLTVTQSAEEATVNTNTLQVRMYKAPADAIAETVAANYDFDATKIANVKFNGKSLTGTIDYQMTDKIKDYVFPLEEDQTGYYYPIAVTGSGVDGIERKITINGYNPKTIKNGSAYIILLPLDNNAADKKVDIKVDGVDYSIDYSKLNFNVIK